MLPVTLNITVAWGWSMFFANSLMTGGIIYKIAYGDPFVVVEGANCNNLGGPTAPYRVCARMEERTLVDMPLLFVPSSSPL